MFPRDPSPDSTGCFVRLRTTPEIHTEFYLVGVGTVPVPSSIRNVWDCAFWVGGTVFVGVVSMAQPPCLNTLATLVALQPQRWMALPAKPTA